MPFTAPAFAGTTSESPVWLVKVTPVVVQPACPESAVIEPLPVTAVTGSGSITADSGHSGCTTTGVTFTNQTGLSLVVPAKAGAVNGTLQTSLTNAASMSNASLNACQGATFTIPVSLTGSS